MKCRRHSGQEASWAVVLRGEEGHVPLCSECAALAMLTNDARELTAVEAVWPTTPPPLVSVIHLR